MRRRPGVTNGAEKTTQTQRLGHGSADSKYTNTVIELTPCFL
jgi:hypothetical protein